MTLILVLGLLAVMLVGIPVSFALGLVGSVWMIFVNNLDMVTLAQVVFFSLNSFPLVAIPLFIIIGILAERTGVLSDMVQWLQMLIGQVRGGMAYINILNSMLLAGISGTATADIASLGRIEIQMMQRAGYSLSYAAALTAASSMLGPIIPPSVVMIIYALSVGNVSIAGLFLAGIIPGLMFAAGMMAIAWYKAREEARIVTVDRPPLGALLRQTAKVVPILILPVIIVGGTTLGVFTVTESAAVGVVYTLVIGLFSARRLTLRDVYDAILYSATISSVAGMLLAAGALLTYIFNVNMVTNALAAYVETVTASPTTFLLMVTGVLLIVGMFMDSIPIVIALAPLLAPIAARYGIPDVQFAMVFIISALIGIVTPPVGMILFLTSSIANISVERLSVAVFPFVLWMITVMVLLALFPALSVFIPRLAGF